MSAPLAELHTLLMGIELAVRDKDLTWREKVWLAVIAVRIFLF